MRTDLVLRLGLALVLAGCSTILGLHNARDDDRDGDHIPDLDDNCPDVPNPDQSDIDHNGVGDSCDGCSSPDPTDSDGDGIPDACDGCDNTQPDLNGDGVPDACEKLGCPGCSPCALGPSHDEDGDLVPDNCDLCPSIQSDLADADSDLVGDACDTSTAPSEQLFDPFTEADPVWYSKGPWQVNSDGVLVNPTNPTFVKSFRQLGTGSDHLVIRSHMSGSGIDTIQPIRMAVYAADGQDPNQAALWVACELDPKTAHMRAVYVSPGNTNSTPTTLTGTGPWTVTLSFFLSPNAIGSLGCTALSDGATSKDTLSVSGIPPTGPLLTGIYAWGNGNTRFDYFDVVSDVH